jgi:hypothetical protein
MAKLAAVLVTLVLVGFCAYQAHETRAAEKKLGAIASTLAGRRVHIECQGFWASLLDVNGRLGDVEFADGIHPSDRAHLTRGICQTLRHFRRTRADCLIGRDWTLSTLAAVFEDPCGDRARGLVQATLTLSHESAHLRGYRDEGAAQCLGIGWLPWVAGQLGATSDEGRAMANYALALQPGMPTEYQFASCPRLRVRQL